MTYKHVVRHRRRYHRERGSSSDASGSGASSSGANGSDGDLKEIERSVIWTSVNAKKAAAILAHEGQSDSSFDMNSTQRLQLPPCLGDCLSHAAHAEMPSFAVCLADGSGANSSDGNGSGANGSGAAERSQCERSPVTGGNSVECVPGAQRQTRQ